MIRAEKPRHGVAIAVTAQDGAVSLITGGQHYNLTPPNARAIADALHDAADQTEETA